MPIMKDDCVQPDHRTDTVEQHQRQNGAAAARGNVERMGLIAVEFVALVEHARTMLDGTIAAREARVPASDF